MHGLDNLCGYLYHHKSRRELRDDDAEASGEEEVYVCCMHAYIHTFGGP